MFGLGVAGGLGEDLLAGVGSDVGAGLSVGRGVASAGDSVGSIGEGSTTGPQAHASTARLRAVPRIPATAALYLSKGNVPSVLYN